MFILLLVATSLSAASTTVKTYGATVVSNVYPRMRAIEGNAAHGDVAFVAASTPLTQHQSPSQPQAISAATTPQPSPFVIAAFIVGLVAVFGALFSLHTGRRGKHASRGRVVERFWAID